MNRLVIASVTAICLCTAASLPAAVQAQTQDVTSQPPPAEAKYLDMSAIPTLAPDRVMKVQQALQRKGFDPGPIDGILGPMTKEAVRKYQDRYGMKATGEIDNQTLYALGGAELASRPDAN